jgi:hypothetical protein
VSELVSLRLWMMLGLACRHPHRPKRPRTLAIAGVVETPCRRAEARRRSSTSPPPADSRRRIDLLALDKTGGLVVIELKRTDDGRHMELQALRYAAMVSSMGFAEGATTYAAHCAKLRSEEEVDSPAELLAFLDMEDADDEDPVISSDVRIMLVSADFGREITTTVLSLNRFDGMDIRCVRLVPYDIEGRVLLDIQ